MDVVFLHRNYPAQFRQLAQAFGAAGHRVVYLTERADAHTFTMEGVDVQVVKPHRDPTRGIHPYLLTAEQSVLSGQAMVRRLDELVRDGLRPRLVISHAGTGVGLFVKQLLPAALQVGYFEWFFRPATSRHLFGRFEMDQQLRSSLRNLEVLHELEQCDLGVVPTAWQAEQFPREFQAKLRVVFDGVDTEYFCPAPEPGALELACPQVQPEDGEPVLRLAADDLVLTYATRGMEPLRGFPEFLRAVPEALARFPRLKVVVGGTDRRAYSYAAPSHEGSWKDHLLAELGDFPGRERLLFCGGLPYRDYRRLLRRSDLHVYFSRPYVVSWSLFEAAACGCRLLVSEGAPVESALPALEALRVNLDDQASVQAGLLEGLARAEREGRGGRVSQLPPELALPACLQQWQTLLNGALQAS